MGSFIKAALCILAAGSLAGVAFAQCPAQPLSALAGTWVFETKGVSFYGAASVGKFTATVGKDFAGNAQGQLSVVESSNFTGPNVGDGSVNRFLTYQGIYTIFNDCSGGTLMLNSNFNLHLQYEFYFRPSATGLEIVMVSISGPRFSVVRTLPVPALVPEIVAVSPVFNGMARKIS